MAGGRVLGSGGNILAIAPRGNQPVSTQQIKWPNGHWLMTENYESGTNTGSGGPGQMASEVALLKASPEMVGYIPCMVASTVEDYTQSSNIALTAGGLTGAALQAKINQQYSGLATWESWFYYQQSQVPGSLSGLIINFVIANGPTGVTGSTNFSTHPAVVPNDVRDCAGSITVPNSYGSTSTTTYQVAPIYTGSPYYGFGFANSNGGTTYAFTVPAYWNPGVNQRQRTQLWQAFYQRTFTYGPAYVATTAYTPGQVVTWTDGNSYLCIANTTGNAPPNATYWLFNRWAGKTPDAVPEFARAKTNDEVTWNCAQNASTGTVVSPPNQGSTSYPATNAAFWAAHGNNAIAVRAAGPTTRYEDCISFGFTGSDGAQSISGMQYVVNHLFPGNSALGLSRIRGWVLSDADVMANNFNLGAPGNGWFDPYGIWSYTGALGMSSGDQWSTSGFTYYSTQFPKVSPYALSGLIGWDGEVQAGDYAIVPHGSSGITANTQSIIIPIIDNCRFAGCDTMTWSPTDNTFSGSVWASYIYPGIVASLSAHALSTVMPAYYFYGPPIVSITGATSTTLTINWAAITGQGTGLSIILYRNGVQIASGAAASFTTYTDTGLTPNTQYSYTLAMQNANGTGPQGAASQGTTSPNYVGINGGSLTYYLGAYPFLNVFKQGGSADNSLPNWITQTSAGFSSDTYEEAYLQQDADYYVKSLTASPIPSGGQVFTQVGLNILQGCQAGVPGITGYYPMGASKSYTFTFQGQGTLTFNGDVTSCTTSTPNVSCAGNTITSTLGVGATGTVTVNFASGTSSSGFACIITALPSSTNYLRNFVLVQTEYVSNYNAGEIFHPIYKAQLSNSGLGGYSLFRHMNWQNANFLDFRIRFTANLLNGATGGTIADMYTTSSLYSTGGGNLQPWIFPSGNYIAMTATGQVITITATAGNPAITWSPALNTALNQDSANGQIWVSHFQGWSGRPLLSNCFWTRIGVPYEAQAALCNELNIDGWFNVPAVAGAISLAQGPTTFSTNLAQLLYNGTGANLTNSNLGSFSGLNAAQKAYIEYSNEYWNASFAQDYFFNKVGGYLYSGNWPVWFGQNLALIGQDFYSAYGSTAFASRVVITMSQQSTNTYDLIQAMNTPGWGGGPAYSTGHIGAIHTGGYFGLDNMTNNSPADVTRFFGYSAANQVNAYFGLMYSNVWSGDPTYTYAAGSMPATGLIGGAVAAIATDLAAISGQPWGTLPYHVYEGGSSNHQYNGAGGGAYATFITSAHRDARTSYIYYDPTHVLDATGTGYFTRMKAAATAAGVTNFWINIFIDSDYTAPNGDYGTLENMMQAISPLSSAPPKYQGIMNYVQA